MTTLLTLSRYFSLFTNACGALFLASRLILKYVKPTTHPRLVAILNHTGLVLAKIGAE
jgi:hypothetical protein